MQDIIGNGNVYVTAVLQFLVSYIYLQNDALSAGGSFNKLPKHFIELLELRSYLRNDSIQDMELYVLLHSGIILLIRSIATSKETSTC